MDYTRIYNQIIERAKNRKLDGYVEKHHIVPKCIGGLDVKENIVKLSAREHFLCHMLLCEMYPKENKLKHALFLMAIGKQKIKEKQYVIGSRVYERLRIEYSKMLTGVSQAEETKLKKSKKMKEVWSSKSEEEMTAIGKKRAINRKKNNSEWHTEEWRKKISNSLKGRDTTPANKSRSKPILQFDLQNHFIQEWPSIAEAERQVGGDIKSAIAGRQKTAAGFIWKSKN
jgi:hypothetical protein